MCHSKIVCFTCLFEIGYRFFVNVRFIPKIPLRMQKVRRICNAFVFFFSSEVRVAEKRLTLICISLENKRITKQHISYMTRSFKLTLFFSRAFSGYWTGRWEVTKTRTKTKQNRKLLGKSLLNLFIIIVVVVVLWTLWIYFSFFEKAKMKFRSKRKLLEFIFIFQKKKDR